MAHPYKPNREKLEDLRKMTGAGYRQLAFALMYLHNYDTTTDDLAEMARMAGEYAGLHLPGPKTGEDTNV